MRKEENKIRWVLVKHWRGKGGSGGHLDTVYKESSISLSGCGTKDYKSIDSIKSKGNERAQLSLSPSLSHSEGDRDRERVRGMALVKSSSSHSDCGTGNLKSMSIKSKGKEGEQNPVGSSSHSDSGTKYYKSIGSIKSKGNERAKLSLSHFEGDRERESERYGSSEEF